MLFVQKEDPSSLKLSKVNGKFELRNFWGSALTTIDEQCTLSKIQSRVCTTVKSVKNTVNISLNSKQYYTDTLH